MISYQKPWSQKAVGWHSHTAARKQDQPGILCPEHVPGAGHPRFSWFPGICCSSSRSLFPRTSPCSAFLLLVWRECSLQLLPVASGGSAANTSLWLPPSRRSPGRGGSSEVTAFRWDKAGASAGRSSREPGIIISVCLWMRFVLLCQCWQCGLLFSRLPLIWEA